MSDNSEETSSDDSETDSAVDRSGSETYSITVINGTTTISTYSISSSSSCSEGNLPGQDENDGAFSIPQSWIDDATGSGNDDDGNDDDTDKKDGGAKDEFPMLSKPKESPAPNDGSDLNQDGNQDGSGTDSEGDAAASGLGFSTSASMSITTTETLITLDDGQSATQRAVSWTWSASFSWLTGDTIDLTAPPSPKSSVLRLRSF